MCVSDIRLARLASTQTRAFSTAAASVEAFLPSRQRIGILIGSATLLSGASYVIVRFTGGHVLIGGGGQPFPNLTLRDYGPVIQQGFTIEFGAGNMTMACTETFLPESYLAVALNEFQSNASERPGY